MRAEDLVMPERPGRERTAEAWPTHRHRSRQRRQLHHWRRRLAARGGEA